MKAMVSCNENLGGKQNKGIDNKSNAGDDSSVTSAKRKVTHHKVTKLHVDDEGNEIAQKKRKVNGEPYRVLTLVGSCGVQHPRDRVCSC